MNIHALFTAVAVVLGVLAVFSALGSAIAERWDLMIAVTMPSAIFFCVAVGLAAA